MRVGLVEPVEIEVAPVMVMPKAKKPSTPRTKGRRSPPRRRASLRRRGRSHTVGLAAS